MQVVIMFLEIENGNKKKLCISGFKALTKIVFI